MYYLPTLTTCEISTSIIIRATAHHGSKITPSIYSSVRELHNGMVKFPPSALIIPYSLTWWPYSWITSFGQPQWVIGIIEQSAVKCNGWWSMLRSWPRGGVAVYHRAKHPSLARWALRKHLTWPSIQLRRFQRQWRPHRQRLRWSPCRCWCYCQSSVLHWLRLLAWMRGSWSSFSTEW